MGKCQVVIQLKVSMKQINSLPGKNKQKKEWKSNINSNRKILRNEMLNY